MINVCLICPNFGVHFNVVPRRSCSTGTKNKPTSLAWTQEKPYIDAGDPRIK